MHTVISKGHAVKSASLWRGSVASSDSIYVMYMFIHFWTNIRPRVVKRAKQNRLNVARTPHIN